MCRRRYIRSDAVAFEGVKPGDEVKQKKAWKREREACTSVVALW